MGKKISVNDSGIQADVDPSSREERWKVWLANYAEKQPVKYAAQLANHEFDKIPDSFK